MRRRSQLRMESAPSPAPTARGLVFAYLLVVLVPVVLWAVSEPVLALVLLAGAVGAVAAQIGLAYALTRFGAASRRRVCVPVTGMCVEF